MSNTTPPSPAHGLTTKGQVTIPKRVRDHLRLKPGDKVAFTIRPDGAVVVTPAPSDGRGERSWAGLRGIWRGPDADALLARTRGAPET